MIKSHEYVMLIVSLKQAIYVTFVQLREFGALSQEQESQRTVIKSLGQVYRNILAWGRKLTTLWDYFYDTESTQEMDTGPWTPMLVVHVVDVDCNLI